MSNFVPIKSKQRNQTNSIYFTILSLKANHPLSLKVKSEIYFHHIKV